MQTDLIATIIFIVLMVIFLITNRKNVTREMILKDDKKKKAAMKEKMRTLPWHKKLDGYILIGIVTVLQKSFFLLRYDTTWGIKWMEKFEGLGSKRGFKYVLYCLIGISVLGILSLIGFLGYTLFLEVVTPELLPASGGIALVLPFKTASQFYVPFMYWILSIMILCAVHEFAHGIMAAAYNVKIKKTGFAFICIFWIPILPAAFVDIGNEWRKRLPASQKMGIAGAGPISNIITAVLCFIIITFAITPYLEDKLVPNGIRIDEVLEGGFAAEHGMQVGDVIKSIDRYDSNLKLDGVEYIYTQADLSRAMQYANGSGIMVHTENNAYSGLSNGKLGIMAKTSFEKTGMFTAAVKWIAGLFYYLVMLNLGIGLMNFIPISICDGGIIVESLYEKATKSQRITKTMMGATTLIFLGLIVLLFMFK